MHIKNQLSVRNTAIVTGGSRGIGRSIVLALAERGWNVVVNYCRDQESANQTLDLVRKAGGTAVAIKADISSGKDRHSLVKETIHQFKNIDLLVNNAGIAPKKRMDILKVQEESYDEVMEVNLKGPFFLTQSVVKTMIANMKIPKETNPIIVNIGSISAYTSSTGRSEYCLSKSGISMMTRLYADRLSEYGINVFEIRPGIIETDMTQSSIMKYKKSVKEGLLLIQRLGKPMDVALAVVAIAENRFPYSTGEIINVDGGFHLHRL